MFARLLACALLVALSPATAAAAKARHHHPAVKRSPKSKAAPVKVARHAPTTLVPDDPLWSSEWGLARIGMPTLWRATASVPGVTIAVVDTGVATGRADLADAVLAGGAGDAVGHGTAVAEVAAGRGDDGVGAAGICWRCRILPVDVAPNGVATASALAAGIRLAAGRGAQVINISLVLDGPDADVAAAVAEAQARGALVVAAAGNGGQSSPTYPAAYPGVVGVVAVDEADRPYPWATRGAWVALAAPGCSTVADASGGGSPFCGSSAATPVVSGLAGLVWNRLGSAAAVRAALFASAAPLDGAVASAGRIDGARLAALLAR